MLAGDGFHLVNRDAHGRPEFPCGACKGRGWRNVPHVTCARLPGPCPASSHVIECGKCKGRGSFTFAEIAWRLRIGIDTLERALDGRSYPATYARIFEPACKLATSVGWETATT